MSRHYDLLDFAKTLSKCLQADSITSSTWSRLREKALHALQDTKRAFKGQNAIELDKLGTKIWNCSLNLSRDDAGDQSSRSIAHLRVFAFSLLDGGYRLAQHRDGQRLEATVRILNIALKTARTCIEQKELELGAKVFEIAADHVKTLTKPDRTDGAISNVEPVHEASRRLANEYWLLRAGLAWEQERPDVIAFHLEKVKPSNDGEDIELAEKMADLTYEIGRGALKRKQWQEAVTWLEKSCKALDEIGAERMTPDTHELQMSTMHDLVRALLAIKDDDSLTRAKHLIALMESEYGNKMAIATLKLSLLSTEDPVAADEYQRVVGHIITTAVLTDNVFSSIMHHIQRLKEWNVNLALKTLDSLLSVRLFEEMNMSYIEKALVTRIWISSTQPSDSPAIASLVATVNRVHDAIGRPFSPGATHAAQTLMWKCIEANQASNQYAFSERWCRLACHRLFDNCGDINKSKLCRKMMQIGLASGEQNAAREAYYQMPESGRQQLPSAFLLYRLALRSNERALTATALEQIVEATRDDPTYLHACVLEAQTFGDRQQTVVVLQAVLRKYDYGSPPDVYLPALLRCTIGLFVKGLEDHVDVTVQSSVGEICKLLEAASRHIPNSLSEGKMDVGTAQLELRWFAKTSYNLALKHCADLDPCLIVRLLEACMVFLECLRTKMDGLVDTSALLRRHLLCLFIAVSATIVLARAEDHIETSLQRYLQVRRSIRPFLDLYDSHKSELEKSAEDLVAKRSQLLHFDLEAILKLSAWDDLDATLDKCLQQDTLSNYKALADLVMLIHTHLQSTNADPKHQAKMPEVMQRIINQSFSTEGHNIETLARWLRCVFRMTVTSNPLVSMQVVEQAASIAARSGNEYPQTELEWLAGSAFNQAVDCHCASDDKGCRDWAEKALELARVGSTGLGRGFYQHMQGLWMRMNERQDL